jgi:uncharacterized protein (TIGR01319 family)
VDSIRLFVDFGSTYTKVVAINLDKEEIVSLVRMPSTVETDITLALDEALKQIAETTGIGDIEKKEALACSSAAGGLRVICAGFVPDYTSKAANHAALGAGAKVTKCYSYKLTEQEIKEIEAAAPDILLISGGTNGGDEEVIIHNARMFSRSSKAITNIIVAGNKTTYDEIRSVFADNGKNVIFTSNVMPEIGVLDVAPCNREIRELFMKNIIEAKGIARAKSIIKDVIMPTPSAVLEAAKLIAEGCNGISGMGELIVIDPGGATTDVHSIAKGLPNQGNTVVVGLPEPYQKRTVEGDLGIKHNLDTLLELLEGEKVPTGFNTIIESFSNGKLPETEEEFACHRILAAVMVRVAMDRHAGKIEVINTPSGEKLIQHGKDLTEISTVIGTGGPIIFSGKPREILEGVLFREEEGFSLKPKKPDFYLDENYILFAIGLLSQVEPEKALNIAKKYLKQI